MGDTEWIRAGDLWKARLPNEFFGDFNPFAESIKHPEPAPDGSPGDWGWLRYGRWAHRGNVYLDGEGLTETKTAAALSRPMTWRAEVDAYGRTTILANFGDRDPAASRVEVNVRPTLFYPATPGLNYIQVRGFVLMNAATPWIPPTVEQLAAIGPNGGHHWVIEGNAILNSKGACLSIGVPSGPAEAWHAARDTTATGRDFFGATRHGGFAYGPFRNLRSGANRLAVFRYGPRRAQALRIINGR